MRGKSMRLVRNLTLTFLFAFAVGWNTYGLYNDKEIKPIENTSTVSYTEPKTVDINQMHCLATNIYHEARGESFAGKVAVANVTHNRVDSKRYPDTYCGVVYQAQMYVNWRGNEVPVRDRCQFSWYCDGKSDDIVLKTADGKIIKSHMIAWEESLEIAKEMIEGNLPDITDGATHYYNHNITQPYWAGYYVQVVQIDNHTFLNSN